MNQRKYIIGLLAATALLFAGCETITDVVYDEQVVETTGTLPVDAVEVSPGKYIAVADLAPGSYTVNQIVPAGTEVTIQAVELVPSRAVTSAINTGSSLLGPYGGLAGLIATGLLGIFGTVQSKRLTTSQKVSTSLVQGIDTFRDILDQTPQGDKIDEALKTVLKERQTALAVTAEVNALLARYKTPTKQSIKLN